MDTKLTLKLEDSAIQKAKVFARQNNQSLSKLVENFFKSLTDVKSKHTSPIPPTVNSLKGIIKSRKKINAKDEYSDYLVKKYYK